MTGYHVVERASGLAFACDECDHEVELAQFVDVSRSKARTLGAAKMNAHIAKAHPNTGDKKLAEFGIK